MLVFSLLIACLFLPPVLAGFTELSGILRCNDCRECGSVSGTIELWEADNLSSDDFQDKKPIVNGKYEGLKFNEFEWFSTEPYFLIKHSCSPLFWHDGKRLPDKLNCRVETKYPFDEPSTRQETIDLDLRTDGKSEIVCKD